MERNLYVHTSVRRPFDEVARLLAEDPAVLLQSATDEANRVADEIRGELHLEVGQLAVDRGITIEVGEFRPQSMLAVSLPLRWRDARHGGLFPVLEATLELARTSRPASSRRSAPRRSCAAEAAVSRSGGGAR